MREWESGGRKGKTGWRERERERIFSGWLSIVQRRLPFISTINTFQSITHSSLTHTYTHTHIHTHTHTHTQRQNTHTHTHTLTNTHTHTDTHLHTHTHTHTLTNTHTHTHWQTHTHTHTHTHWQTHTHTHWHWHCTCTRNTQQGAILHQPLQFVPALPKAAGPAPRTATWLWWVSVHRQGPSLITWLWVCTGKVQHESQPSNTNTENLC